MVTLTIRASSVPLALICAGSARPAEVKVHVESEAANAGTAVHAMLAEALRWGRPDWGAIPEMAVKHRCDERDLRFLLNAGWGMWERVKVRFSDAPSTEVERSVTIGGLTLTGHTDVEDFIHATNQAEVWDHKTDRKDTDYSGQLKAYAALILLKAEELGSPITKARAGIGWIRADEVEDYRMTLPEARLWFNKLSEHLLEWDGTHNAGPHCEHCPRAHECPAAAALARKNVEMFAGGGATLALEALSPDELIAILGRADAVRRAAEELRSRVKDLMLSRGEVVGSKQKLVFEQQNRRSLKVLQALPVLREAGLQDADLESALSAEISKLEDIVAKRAGRGLGSKAVGQLRAALDDVGAIEYVTVNRLTTKRVT